MYTTTGETGYSSPAVVNDVIFMSTTQMGLYAFDAASGLCLWSADPVSSRRRGYIRGPVVYRDFLVIGTSRSIGEGSLKIYTL
jgi:outer membrane protein assembly factor BamB